MTVVFEITLRDAGQVEQVRENLRQALEGALVKLRGKDVAAAHYSLSEERWPSNMLEGESDFSNRINSMVSEMLLPDGQIVTVKATISGGSARPDGGDLV